MDKRYLYSWLTFIGVMGVAWLMSQMDDGSDRRQAATLRTGTTPGPDVAGGDSSESLGVGMEGGSQGAAGVDRRVTEATGGGGPVAGVEPRRFAAGGASPTIPGLLDDESFGNEGVGDQPTTGAVDGTLPAQFDWENPSTESALVRSGVSATVPLRPAGMERAKSAGDGGLTPLPAGAPALDGSTLERRVVPTFSMPNTQRAEPAGPSLSDVSTQAGRAANGPLPSGPSAENPSGAALQPQFLPGERHVLRPIMRSGLPVSSAASSLLSPPATLPSPAGSSATIPAPAGSSVGGTSLAGMSSGAGPASVWDAPMPGVKAGGVATAAPAVPTVGNASGHDPLFVQVAEGLARESTAWANNPSGGAASSAAAGNAPRGLLAPGGSLAPAASLSPGTGSAPGVGAVRPGARGVGRPRATSGDYIWHEIRQNQTLESISLQYQGDTSLAGPIAELNRDILPDPQLLPIGRAIRVPIR